MWEPFGSCLLNRTANPAHFHDFFQSFSIYLFNYFMKNLQTTIALLFLAHNISAIGGVLRNSLFIFYFLLSILPCKWKTLYRKSRNQSDKKPKTKLPKYVMSWALISIFKTYCAILLLANTAK